MSGGTRQLILHLIEALFKYDDCLLRVHIGNQVVSDEGLLDVLMVEEIADLKEINDIYWVI